MSHPYNDLPDYCFWGRAVTHSAWADINFKPVTKFQLAPATRIGTAGSCFAQNIGKHLKKTQRSIFNAEAAPWVISSERAEALTFGHFSARYGNIYTPAQLRQLIEQALGLRPIIYELCEHEGRWYDLLRPRVQPGGYLHREEAVADRNYHLSRVKALFSEADCFVFTFGLTETWVSRSSGAVFPACPGTVVGAFSEDDHQFENLGYMRILEDMRFVIGTIHQLNPAMKWILTVSPVHLVATAENESVVTASTYSKSVLRAVAGDLAKRYDYVDYFPAYEIISSAASFGQYLAADLRDAASRGVDHVMRVFDQTYFPTLIDGRLAASSLKPGEMQPQQDITQQLAKAINRECEEMFNDPAFSGRH